jgi:hypothetical protein
MGSGLVEFDMFVASFFELANLRFAPRHRNGPEWFGGLDEMVELQKEFQVFQKGRSFKQSAALLGLGPHMTPLGKARWLNLLADQANYPSNIPGLNGDEAIVDAIQRNLASPSPRPVHFKAHDSRPEGQRRVIVDEEPRPLFYINEDFLTISIPMKPKAE